MVTWTFTISPIDVLKDIVTVSALAVDDTPGIEDITVSLQNADISSPVKQAAALDALWAKYAKKALDAAVARTLASKITALQTSAKANFEGRSL